MFKSADKSRGYLNSLQQDWLVGRFIQFAGFSLLEEPGALMTDGGRSEKIRQIGVLPTPRCYVFNFDETA